MEIPRCLLIFFNVIFAITGLIVLTVGILAERFFFPIVGYSTFFGIAPLVVIAVGFFIFIVSFMGCFGAAIKNNCTLSTFAGILLIIFAIQFVFGLVGFIQLDSLRENTINELNNTIRFYNMDDDVKSKFDSIQEDFSCCGINGPDDWINLGIPIPESCCKDIDLKDTIKNTTCTAQTLNVYKGGCNQSFTEGLKFYAIVFSCVTLVFSILQITGVALACHVVSNKATVPYDKLSSFRSS